MIVSCKSKFILNKKTIIDSKMNALMYNLFCVKLKKVLNQELADSINVFLIILM
jgi:hypothetical protein